MRAGSRPVREDPDFVPTEGWGAELYGDPCRECSYDWGITPTQAVQVVEALPSVFGELLDGATGSERHADLAWGATGYVCHVSDNLRTWADGLAAGLDRARVTPVPVPGYDPDLLAVARRYDLIDPDAALCALTSAVSTWMDVVPKAVHREVLLWHARRGEQRAADVAVNNAHDAMHHVWDVRRILGSAREA